MAPTKSVIIYRRFVLHNKHERSARADVMCTNVSAANAAAAAAKQVQLQPLGLECLLPVTGRRRGRCISASLFERCSSSQSTRFSGCLNGTMIDIIYHRLATRLTSDGLFSILPGRDPLQIHIKKLCPCIAACS